MNGGEIFGWVWFGLCALPFAGIAIYFILIGIYLLLVIICKYYIKVSFSFFNVMPFNNVDINIDL